jgi:hypothetical protein
VNRIEALLLIFSDFEKLLGKPIYRFTKETDELKIYEWLKAQVSKYDSNSFFSPSNFSPQVCER